MTRPAFALALAPALILALLGGAVGAQEVPEPHDMDGMGDMPAAMQGYMAAMTGMMDAMPQESTGSADVDFLQMMIHHHQSAIDMGHVLLEHGEDPAVRTLAEEIIAEQEAEIARMQELLAANAPEGGDSGEIVTSTEDAATD